MNIIDIDSLRPSPNRAARFQGMEHGAKTSFFVVNSPPGRGVNKHRHPYEEVFVIFKGEIEVVIGGEAQTIGSGNITVIPPNTWHEFMNRSDYESLMVTIHSSPKMVQEDWRE